MITCSNYLHGLSQTTNRFAIAVSLFKNNRNPPENLLLGNKDCHVCFVYERITCNRFFAYLRTLVQNNIHKHSATSGQFVANSPMFFQHHWTYGGKIKWFVCLYQVGEKTYEFNAWAGALLTCDLNVGVHSWLKHHGRPSREQPLCNANFYLFDFDLVTTWFKQFPWVSQIWTRKNHPTLHKIRKFDACLYTHVSENDACNYTTGNSDTQKKMWADRGVKKIFPQWNQFVDAIFFWETTTFWLRIRIICMCFSPFKWPAAFAVPVCKSQVCNASCEWFMADPGWDHGSQCWWDCCVLAWWKICSKLGNPSTTHGCSGFLDSCINSQEDATSWIFCVFAYKKPSLLVVFGSLFFLNSG